MWILKMWKVNEQLFVINAFIWQHLNQFDYLSFVKVEEGQEFFLIRRKWFYILICVYGYIFKTQTIEYQSLHFMNNN